MAHFSLTEKATEYRWPAGEVEAQRAGHRRAESNPVHRTQLPLWMDGIAARLSNAEDATLPPNRRLTELAAMGAQLDNLFVDPACVPGIAPEHRSMWAERFLHKAAGLLVEQVIPDLCISGICVVPVDELTDGQQAWLHDFFRRSVYPILTPLAVDPGHPFPYISSDSLNLLVELRSTTNDRNGDGKLFARVKVPRSPARLIEIPAPGDAEPSRAGPLRLYVWSADMVRHFIGDLFPEMPVRQVHIFRVLRAGRSEDEDIQKDERFEARALWRSGRTVTPTMFDGVARRREETPAVRLDVEETMPRPVLEWLMQRLNLHTHEIFRHRCTLEIVCLPYLTEKAAEQSHTQTLSL